MQVCKWQVAKHEGLRAFSPFPILSAVCLAQGLEHCRLSPGFLGPDRSLLHAGPSTAHFPGLFLAEASALGGSLAALHPTTHTRWCWTCMSCACANVCVCVCVCVCVYGGVQPLCRSTEKNFQMSRFRPSPCLQSRPPVSCSGTSAEPEPNVAALRKIRPKSVLCLPLCFRKISAPLDYFQD